MGIELMVSIWPTISPLSENFDDYRDRGLLVGSDQGVEFHQTIQDKGMVTPMPLAFYDPSNPETREYVWDLVRRNYLDLGIRVFWLDACEPELNPAHPGTSPCMRGPARRWPTSTRARTRACSRRAWQAAGREPTVLLCRSAWAGSQKYGAAVWSGDIPATWQSLAQQVAAGLNIAVSGIPWWTTDIGGFHGGDASDPAYRELMVRWFQYGVFCPLFRLHGDREPRTPTELRADRWPERGLVVRRRGLRDHRGPAPPARTAAPLRPRAHGDRVRHGSPADAPALRGPPRGPALLGGGGPVHVRRLILVAPVTQAGARDARSTCLPEDGGSTCAPARRSTGARRCRPRLRSRRSRCSCSRDQQSWSACDPAAASARSVGPHRRRRILGRLPGAQPERRHPALPAPGWSASAGWATSTAGPRAGPPSTPGVEFADSEVYKLLEAMAWEPAAGPTPGSRSRVSTSWSRGWPRPGSRRLPPHVVRAPRAAPRYSDLEWGHELYCFGHLFQAAVRPSHRRHAASSACVEIARLADHVYAEFGPDGRDEVCGHPEIEPALVELHRATGRAPAPRLGRAASSSAAGTAASATSSSAAEYFQRRHPGPRGRRPARTRGAGPLPGRRSRRRRRRDRRPRAARPPASGSGRTASPGAPT